MPAPLSPESVVSMMSKGIKQIEIAQKYGVSRQYVGQLAKRGGYVSPITMVQENLPWDVAPQHLRNTAYKALTLHGHYRLSPETLRQASASKKLRALYGRLINNDVVIDYDPSYPAVPGLLGAGGFAFVPREEEDENFIIKIRPGIRLTRLGNQLWRFPTNIPRTQVTFHHGATAPEWILLSS